MKHNMPKNAPHGKKGGPPVPPMDAGKVFARIIKMLVKFYPVMVPVAVGCIVFAAVAAALPDLIIQKVMVAIQTWVVSRNWDAAYVEILPQILKLVILYVIALIAVVLQSQIMAIMTQGYLYKMRRAMFEGMQDLPIRFFDTNKHGDIMSYYTNDIDTLRQLVSQALPAIIRCGAIIIGVLAIMLYWSVWMTIVILVGVFAMMKVARKFGGGSAKYFMRQQKALGHTEGFVQEMMSGQKVIKVFSREEKCEKEFDEINEVLFEDGYRANAYANTLGPIIMNIGNILYVVVAVVGGLFILSGLPNVSLSGLAFDITMLVPFLNMTKQFTGNVNQLSQQINSVVMGLSGANRIFTLMDEAAEADHGKVTLVNVKEENGQLSETKERTHHWAWKCPGVDGAFTYVPLRGDVRLNNVDFSYVEGKEVLHDVSVYAEPGQKVAFVGATGAGKTTITNLVNRFYDIDDGKILYDGISVNDIKKSDLRRSLGLVLQDTNLFTGTVMENIRYGRLEATDEECIEAAKLSGAHDFIMRLSKGYDTFLAGNGAAISQGERQLIAIARAAVADPPVMILDEATSSIDTRTESIVQRGLDKLMEGRTVFVIAHRLSTVRNSDVIMVLENGRIIERGNHEKLIEEKGTYYQLYTGAFELE